MKMIVKVLLGVCGLLVLLNYIPVKFAIREPKPQTTMVSEENGKVVIVGSVWDYYKDHQTGRSPDSPQNLMDYINDDSVYHNDNTYRYEAEVQEDGKLNITKADILYPVERTFFRSLFTPENYLTIYDFEWGKIIRDYFDTL